MFLLYGVVELSNKLIDKLISLTAFFFAVCFVIHLIPDYIWRCTLWPEDSVFGIIPIILMSVASVLLFLDLFPLKIKLVQNKYWVFFAAIGIAPSLPHVLVGFPLLISYLIGRFADFF